MSKAKRILLIFHLPVILLMIFTACQKDPEPDPYHLKCQIDHKSWESTFSLTAELQSGIIILNGVNASMDTLRLLLSDQQPGSYTIKNTNNICVYKCNGVTYLPLNSDNSDLTIISHDATAKTIEGTFYYTADDGAGNRLQINNGQFKVVYK